MQVVSAIVRPHKVGEVCGALHSVGFRGMTVTDALGFGGQAARGEIYRGVEMPSSFQHMSRLDIVAEDEDVHDIVGVICSAAATGKLGDGKIWISPVTEVVQIRSRHVGSEAL